MKVTYQDDRLLQLKPQGGRILLLVGALMVLFTPLWLWLMGQSTTFTCERISSGPPECTLSRAILGITISDVAVRDLRGARIAQSTDSDGDTMYRLMIMANDREIPFTTYTSSSYSGKASAVEDIERYLSDNSIPTLTIQDAGMVGLIVSSVFIAIGAGLVIGGARSLSSLWTFDRDYDLVVKYRKTLRGPKEWRYTLSEINNVIVSSSRDSDGDRTYRVELFTDQGERIPMSSWYSSGYARKQRTADAIRAFIGLP